MFHILLSPAEKAALNDTLRRAYGYAAFTLKTEAAYFADLPPADPEFGRLEALTSDLEAYCDDFDLWLREFAAEEPDTEGAYAVDLDGAWAVMGDFERFTKRFHVLKPVWQALDGAVQTLEACPKRD